MGNIVGRCTILGLALLVALTAVASDSAFGQEKKKLSWVVKPENSKVTIVQTLDIPDIAGHVMRINEIRRTWPDGAPTVEGRKVLEEITHGFSDMIAGNGKGFGYSTWRYENGDRTFSEWQLTTQTVVNLDRGRKISFIGTYVMVGGSGAFKGIKGLGRFSGAAELDAEGKTITSQLSGEGEYWFEK